MQNTEITIPVFSILRFLLLLVLFILLVWLLILGIRALKRYLDSKQERLEKESFKASLGETIKHYRTSCNMTQEFVADSLGVSRQAVSKWESGKSDPSTSNLIALAKLFGISAETLLDNVQTKNGDSGK